MVVCGATKHGKLRTCHVPRTACDQHGIAQVSPSKDVKQMEEVLERLRSENFNLRIRIGDFESDSAFPLLGLRACSFRFWVVGFRV